MQSPSLSVFAALIAVAALGCENGTDASPIPVYEASTPEGGMVFMFGAGRDAAPDGTVSVEASTDAETTDAATKDAAPDVAGDATVSDAHAEATSSPDAGIDSTHEASAPVDATKAETSTGTGDAAADASGPVACTSVGGTCVAMSACAAPSTVGSSATFTCGSGDVCCLPATSGAPLCMDVGTAMEGWYTPTGTLLCTNACSGLTPTCERKGTSSQGWYSTSGHGCPPHSTEIENDPTCQ